ncbi:DUF2971 domain-containing protein [Serratia marcescens]|uniref:DUF2971 domain-containing protein n=1 Tax=Serratia TaxID=613 RepID=UPI0013BD51EF|nr:MULTISPECIES: DUF2971 domain-containing protein [Serratia]MEB7895125.1 DUF2971 domain-containing protein [Serratia ureilytica]NDY47842.1 DUF2971 domain-containing protein [Serratia marcescens]NDY52585.1 DUF2971 domain-containing protein [Serratia marcescens]NDY65071.1 DUF2971 domain-containing protein [Serratia marcescens]NDY69670.1 DUF2971 domain-containing protein [Serratia marcescens]
MANKPSSLFKYLIFNENTLNLMCKLQAYYSDPANFNDPLDCKPKLENDLALDELKTLFTNITLRKLEKQFSQSLKKLRFSAEKNESRAFSLANSEVNRIVSNMEYNSTDPDINNQELYLQQTYTSAIEKEIVNTFKTGVLCLSSKFDSPLMWSHYANKHQGICIEYDVTDVKDDKVHKVVYGGSRKILTSDVSIWLNNRDDDIKLKQVCLLTKSDEWRYESEWRIFGRIGLGDSLPPIKSIIFGLKCEDVTIYTVMKAMIAKGRKLKFWKVYNDGDKFKLKRKQIYPHDYENDFPYLYSTSEMLSDLDWD